MIYHHNSSSSITIFIKNKRISKTKNISLSRYTTITALYMYSGKLEFHIIILIVEKRSSNIRNNNTIDSGTKLDGNSSCLTLQHYLETVQLADIETKLFRVRIMSGNSDCGAYEIAASL